VRSSDGLALLPFVERTFSRDRAFRTMRRPLLDAPPAERAQGGAERG
jgi:hypothetical protein